MPETWQGNQFVPSSGPSDVLTQSLPALLATRQCPLSWDKQVSRIDIFVQSGRGEARRWT